MIVPVSPSLLARFGGAALRWAFVALAMAALLWVAGKTVGAVFDAGVRQAETAASLREAKMVADFERRQRAYEKQIDDAAKALAVQEAESQLKLMEAQARVKVVVKRVEVALDANPAFAALERPADLQRVRLDDFAGIADAAQEGANLSEPGVAGLPAAGAGHGPDAGVSGEGGHREPPAVAGVRPRP